MKVAIKGVGWITSGGYGCGGTNDGFSMFGDTLPAISRRDVFQEPYARFGRLDDFSRTGLAAMALTLKDAGLAECQTKRNINLIVGTSYGCLETDMNYFDTVIPDGGAFASPNLFVYTLPNTFLGEAAIRFKLTGNSFVVTETGSQRLNGLCIAIQSLHFGTARESLAGICDTYVSRGDAPDNHAPLGAVFVFLERSDDVDSEDIDILELKDEERLYLNSSPIHGWPELVDGLLRSRTQGDSIKQG